MNRSTLTRRGLIGTGLGALVIGWCEGRAVAAPVASALNDWLRIGADGSVVVRVNCVEMGQGSQTGFAQIVADELEADWTTVCVEQAPVEKPWYTPWGNYMTGGSASIENHFDKLRGLGASARAMLTQAAANRWRVDVAECRATNGNVIHTSSGRTLSFGALAVSAGRLMPPAAPPLKARADWRYIGKSMQRLDLPSKVNGSAVFGIDVAVPGMLVAALSQCPQFGGKLAHIDEKPALAIEGVRRVVRLENAVVVVATGYWRAQQGLAALKPEWAPGPMAGVSSADISRKLRELAEAGGQVPTSLYGADADRIRDAVDHVFNTQPRQFSQTYEVPLLSHSPMEPMNATAWVRDGRADIWAPTQVQSEMRTAVAKALSLGEADVNIHTPLIGGGFGRRLQTDYGVLAAQVAREIDAPVKLIWSRAEDTQHGFYRCATVARLQAALDEGGAPQAFRADIGCLDTGPFGGISTTPYGLRSWVAASTWNPGVPIGSWRSVDWTQNTFFVESFIDELALLAGEDPLAYRLRLLSNNARMLRLLRAVAERSEWPRPPPQGRARGVALCERGGTCCAEIVELSATEGAKLPTVHKITVAIDCGIAINPGLVLAQVEGGVTMALSAALAQEITLVDGKVEQANFDSYPVVRLVQMPNVDAFIVESPDEKITGVGEAPVPPLAPALCNALYAATGKRVRSLPIAKFF